MSGRNTGWRGAFVLTGAAGLFLIPFWLFFFRLPSRHPRLTEPERAALQKELEARRKKGMETLENFKRNGTLANEMPAFVEKQECAVCNGAVGIEYLPRAK